MLCTEPQRRAQAGPMEAALWRRCEGDPCLVMPGTAGLPFATVCSVHSLITIASPAGWGGGCLRLMTSGYNTNTNS